MGIYIIRITAAVVIVIRILGQCQSLMQHLAVSLVHHVLASGVQRVKSAPAIVAPDADKVPGDLFAQIQHQTLQICYELRIGNEERMLH